MKIIELPPCFYRVYNIQEEINMVINRTIKKTCIIPDLKLYQTVYIEEEDIFSCYYSIDDCSKKEESIQMLKEYMQDYISFALNYDCKMGVEVVDRKWYCDGHVCIYENTSINKGVGITGSITGYECVLFIHANK